MNIEELHDIQYTTYTEHLVDNFFIHKNFLNSS